MQFFLYRVKLLGSPNDNLPFRIFNVEICENTWISTLGPFVKKVNTHKSFDLKWSEIGKNCWEFVNGKKMTRFGLLTFQEMINSFVTSQPLLGWFLESWCNIVQNTFDHKSLLEERFLDFFGSSNKTNVKRIGALSHWRISYEVANSNGMDLQIIKWDVFKRKYIKL